jgi:hypothetical protein
VAAKQPVGRHAGTARAHGMPNRHERAASALGEPEVDSLNLAVAGSILMDEVLRRSLRWR